MCMLAGLSVIQHLIQSPEATISDRAHRIISTYFDHEDDEVSAELCARCCCLNARSCVYLCVY